MNRKWIVVGVIAVLAVIVAALLWPHGGKKAASPQARPGVHDPAGPARQRTPDRGGIDGKVRDPSGAPVPGAVIRAAPASRLADDDAARTAVAGADGSYAIEVGAGAWLLTASAAGHTPGEAGVEVSPGQRATADLTVGPAGASLVGEVRDATGGSVAGALIVLAPEEGILAADTRRAAAAMSDAAGRFEVGLVPGRWRVATSHPEYVRDERSIDVGPAGATIDISLTPGGVVEGTVRDLVSSAPVGGARIRYAREVIASGPVGGQAARERESGTVVAASDGTFRVSGLGAGRIVLRAETDDDRASSAPTEVLLGVAESATDVDVFVAATLSISGKVVYDDGTAAAGASISVYVRGDGRNVDAGEDGTFRVSGVRAGDYLVNAETDDAPSGLPVTVTVVDRPVTDVVLTVKRGAYVTGTVDPPGPAEITVRRPDDAQIMPMGMMRVDLGGGPTARAGHDGTFRIGPFAPGPVTLAAKAPDGSRGSTALEVIAKGVDGVTITLERRGSIAGRVVSAGGKPVPGAVVSLHRSIKGAQRTTIVNGVDVDADRAPTGPDGRFAVAGLDEGTWELTVLDARGAPLAFDRKDQDAPERVVLGKGESKENVELVIEAQDGVIKGVVMGPDGAPVPDAWVTASTEDAFIPGLGRMGRGRGPDEEPPHPPDEEGEGRSVMITMVDSAGPQAGEIPPVLTDENGRFEITHLRHGTYRVAAEGLRGGARGALTGVATGSDITIKLATLSKLRGTVTLGGKPVTDFEVAVEGPTRKQSQIHDAGGAFSMTGLDPGDYEVVARSPDGEGRATATIVAGQEATVTIEIIGDGRVTGVLVDAQGTPLAGRMVAIGARMQAGEMRIELGGEPPMTGADGSFTASSPPGARTMFILGEQGPELRKDVDVVAGQTTDLGTIKSDPTTFGGPGGPGGP